MENIEELIEFNRLNPINRYFKIIYDEDDAIKSLSIRILLTLKIIDDVLQKYCNIPYHYYIKCDETIYHLLCKLFDKEDISIGEFDKAMFILDFSKLIYRFTCAKKFKQNNTNIFQLRLNSWGREYISLYMKIENNDYKKIQQFVDQYCYSNLQIYNEITKLLLGELSDQDILTIKKINSLLDIKLLS